MPRDQLSPVPPDAAVDRGESSAPSRRSVLRGAAGVGATGLAAGALAGLGGQALAATAKPGSKADHETDGAFEAHESEALVVHVRDPRTGRLDLYSGTSQVQVHDTELAARLVRASRSAASNKQVR